jgi:hypothetical protein
LYWDNTNSRLGVGTSSPAFKLDVRDGAHIATNANTSPFIVSRLYKISNFEEVRIGVDDANLNIHYINDEYQSKINFRIQNTDTENHDGSLASDWTIMTLSATQSGGNVGIGTTSPEAKLHVYTSNINEKSFMSKDNGGAHIFMVPELGSDGYNPMSSAGDVGLIYSGSNGMNTGSIVIGQWSAFARGIKINTDGNVGIGTSTPAAKLHVAGNIKTNTINETSDARFKKNIQSIDTPLSKVLSLRGVYFYWDLDNPDVQEIDSSKQIGMIAQEVEKILPELVNTDANGYKSVEYSRVVAVLVEAMKEQQKTIEQQQKTIDEQKDMINNLNERITKLEELIKVK